MFDQPMRFRGLLGFVSKYWQEPQKQQCLLGESVENEFCVFGRPREAWADTVFDIVRCVACYTASAVVYVASGMQQEHLYMASQIATYQELGTSCD